MNRDELLTKLAMELEEWPSAGKLSSYIDVGAAPYFKDAMFVGEKLFAGPLESMSGYKMTERFAWLQRRAELINRPSWDDAPEWAQWLAQDSDGQWWWYEKEPYAYGGAWVEPSLSGDIGLGSAGKIPAGHRWQDTLEPRPQTQSDIKTCRHCDIEFRRPHVDGIPDDRCTRCDDEIKALCIETEPARTAWTSKTCTECGHTTAAKVSDDDPVCPGCVALGPDVADGGPDVISGQYAKAPCGSDANACTLNPCGQCDEHEPALRDHRPGLNKMHLDSGTMQTRSKYHREIKPGVWVDVYDVLRAWGVKNPALQHLIKKALAPGERGHKTLEQDMNDIVASARRAKELES